MNITDFIDEHLLGFFFVAALACTEFVRWFRRIAERNYQTGYRAGHSAGYLAGVKSERRYRP